MVGRHERTQRVPCSRPNSMASRSAAKPNGRNATVPWQRLTARRFAAEICQSAASAQPISPDTDARPTPARPARTARRPAPANAPVANHTAAKPATNSTTERSRRAAKLRAATKAIIGTSSGNIMATIISAHSAAKRCRSKVAKAAAMPASAPSIGVARGATQSARSLPGRQSSSSHAASAGAIAQRKAGEASPPRAVAVRMPSGRSAARCAVALIPVSRNRRSRARP
jgi:hypothetical protein